MSHTGNFSYSLSASGIVGTPSVDPGAESEQAASEMMQAFERKIKSTNTVALIAVGVCVLAAAVALIVRFAM